MTVVAGYLALSVDLEGLDPEAAEDACFAAGALAGVTISLLVTRAPADRRRRWLTTLLVASLTSALGCVGLGAAGVLFTVVALVASATLVWIPVSLRAS